VRWLSLGHTPAILHADCSLSLQGCDSNKPLLHCPGQTDVEYRTEFSLWSLGASSLIVATDVRNMTDIMKEVLLNTEIIAVNQDKLGY